MNKELRIMLWLLFLPLLLMWLRVGWVALYPYNPIEITDKDKLIRILNPKKQVVAGQNVIFKIQAYKYMPVPARVYLHLIDGDSTVLDVWDANSPVGPINIKKEKLIPANRNPGKYKLYLVCESRVSLFPLKYFPTSAWSEEFEVIK